MIFHLYIYNQCPKIIFFRPHFPTVISYLFIFLHVDGTNVGDETVIFIVQ